MLLLVHPWTALALSPRTYCWLRDSLSSTKTSRSFSEELLVRGLFLPRCRALYLPLLNSRQFFSDPLFKPSRSFRRAAQPSGVSATPPGFAPSTNLLRKYSAPSSLCQLLSENQLGAARETPRPCQSSKLRSCGGGGGGPGTAAPARRPHLARRHGDQRPRPAGRKGRALARWRRPGRAGPEGGVHLKAAAAGRGCAGGGIGQGNWQKMSPGKVLQPVVEMKLDELFLCWLSQPATQLILKECLRRIKNKEKTEFDDTDSRNSKNKSFTSKNSNSKQCILEDTRLALLSLNPPQLSTTLPLATPASSKNISNVRATQRSSGTKEVQTKKEETLPPPHSQNIPTFYFPRGCPKEKVNIDAVIAKIEKTFSEFPNERATLEDMGKVAKACECPLYWKGPLFYCAGGERTGYVSVHKFVAMWRKVLQTCYDDAAKFVHLLMNPGCNYLVQEDFIPFLQDVVNSHPGLLFLKEASEFHSRYITTVIQRIFYTVNRSWSGKITCNELRKSNFLQNVALLEEEADINQLTEYFSYEHFYVIYCKFWELDTDHDLYIDRKDLARHNDYAISNRMIERIFSGAVTRGRKAQKDGKISYADFVWFLISEEDKKTPTSIEYWFRCMDLDGDGALSMYELEYFYEEQCQKLENMAIEPLPFEDCLCQMLDLVKPQHEGKITLHDLKRCKLTNVFFDTFFNIEKYLDHEQKDQFSMLRDGEGESQEVSDWEKYAAEEYDILVAEEAASEQWNDGYEAELSPVDHQKASVLKYQMEKRPFFEMPSHLADVDLDEYGYDEDFE